MEESSFLPGEPFSREWLLACAERGIIDGFIIIDEETTATVLQSNPPKTRQELVEAIVATHGHAPVEVYLNDDQKLNTDLLSHHAETGGGNGQH